MKTQVKLLQHSGSLKVEEVQEKDYRFVVHIRNDRDFNFNGNVQQDRFAAAKEVLKDRCEGPEIATEAGVQQGNGFASQPRIVWLIYVKCNSTAPAAGGGT